ncbi:Glutathione S-transferase [Mycena venus]|uniref:glutathione transferase n=1 Tax=Mycena venus TaxID=2733690 RepID=A0A8H6Y877_9AGAR|nr:Glutathione S-transferase [Mycena venus]
MVLKLYAAPIARGSSGVVAFVLAEKQIPFELIVVDMSANDHKTAEFLAMHPFGQVPVINDDGFILYEGRAICRYPRREGRALVEQAASIEYANFYPAIAKLGMELVANPRRGLPVNQVVVTQALAELSTTLDVYDTILGKQKFLAGDQFTLADVFHLIAAPRLASEGVDILTTKGPNLARWWNEVISRLAWVRLQAEGIKSTPSW